MSATLVEKFQAFNSLFFPELALFQSDTHLGSTLVSQQRASEISLIAVIPEHPDNPGRDHPVCSRQWTDSFIRRY
jgi:hypothetical protein